MTGVFLKDLTWDEARERFADDPVVVIPIGAASKAHGLHLPLDTDRRVATALADAIAAALPVVVAPVIDLGYYPAFTDYAGSQHLRAETFAAVVVDLAAGFVKHGVRRLAIVNTGVSTEAPLRLACREVLERHGVAIATADIRMLGRAAKPLFRQREGGHADEEETSLMLAIAPETVRLERARPDYGPPSPGGVFHRPGVLSLDPASPDHHPTGATGDPTLATPEKGRQLLQAMVDDLVEGLRAAFPEVLR